MTETFQTLRRLVPAADNAEHCGLCRQALGPRHEHLINPRSRRLMCSCQPCAILFQNPAAQLKRVPKRIRFLPDCDISEADWDALMIPIGIAFFVRQSQEDGTMRTVAYYPSPAGPVESLLALESWSGTWKIMDELEPNVEALMVNRASCEYFVLPIDECYRLVGLMRTHWKGLSGGGEVWREMKLFFEEMKGRAVVANNNA